MSDRSFPTTTPLEHTIINAAPGVFVILWSSGFIGAKLGLPYAEPLTFLFLRMIGALLLSKARPELSGEANARGDRGDHWTMGRDVDWNAKTRLNKRAIGSFSNFPKQLTNGNVQRLRQRLDRRR
jgi:hypothetical protein